MATILKKPTESAKGVICFTHKEVSSIKPSCLQGKYFLGVHYGGFSIGATVPNWASFYFGRNSVVGNANHAIRIPLASANFTPECFKQIPCDKMWDIINVSRNARLKNLNLFFDAVKRLYSRKKMYRVLLVCPTRREENDWDHYTNITEVYYGRFSEKEREYFTLLRLSPELHYLGLSQSQLAMFYQHSKVCTLFSETEGSPKVITEALLCGCPIVVYNKQLGSGRDFLDKNNSVQFGNFAEADVALEEAVENYTSLIPSTALYDEMSITYTLPLLKQYLAGLYQSHGQVFDGELINTDNLNLRLPAHYVYNPWATSPYYTSDIKNAAQWEEFLRHV